MCGPTLVEAPKMVQVFQYIRVGLGTHVLSALNRRCLLNTAYFHSRRWAKLSNFQRQGINCYKEKQTLWFKLEILGKQIVQKLFPVTEIWYEKLLRCLYNKNI